MAFIAPQIAASRMALGLLQGITLYGLYLSAEQKIWPATANALFAALLAIAIFVPAIVISGLGNLRARTLVIWLVVATALCGGLAAYDIFREPLLLSQVPSSPRNIPSAITWLALAAALFILHTLVVSGEIERRWIATYQQHFDVAWKHGVQFVLTTGFVGAFWCLLFLGAELFHMIGIDTLRNLIQRNSFSIPAIAIAVSAAIHITDIRAGIVRDTRNLLLILLAWLLPLMTLIGAGFLTALAFTGLHPLYATKFATGILLIAAAAIIFLVNAAHQDGRPTQQVAPVLTYTKLPATVVLVLLVVLSGHALSLRIVQYGWTPYRIIASACVALAALYAIGYAMAAIRSRQSMTGLETTNMAAALAAVALIIALASPLIDPMRISVWDQVARLRSGKVAPEKFDFAFLRSHSGRFGATALEGLAALKEGANATVIADRARLAIKSPSCCQQPVASADSRMREENIKVRFPNGAALPLTFINQDWPKARNVSLPTCLTRDARCDAILADIDGDGKFEILLYSYPAVTAFQSNADGQWIKLGVFSNSRCGGVRDAFEQGRFEVAAPVFKDLIFDGYRLRMSLDDCKRLADPS